MKLKYFFALALATQVAGCNTVSTPNTPSGKVEVTVKNAKVETVKTALVNRHLSKGWTISNDSTFVLQFDKPSDSAMVNILLGSKYDSTPNARITYSLAQLGQDARVVADLAIVTNPGSAYERKMPVNSGEPAIEVQKSLNSLANVNVFPAVNDGDFLPDAHN